MNNLRKSAQSLIEYGLILALVAIIALTVLGKFGKTVTNASTKTDATVQNAATNAGDAYCKQINGTYDKTTSICKPPANTLLDPGGDGPPDVNPPNPPALD